MGRSGKPLSTEDLNIVSHPLPLQTNSVYVDFTTLMMKPMDSVFDEFINDSTLKFRATNDYPTNLPNTGKNFGINTHWVMVKPSQSLFTNLTDAYLKSYYSPTMGWNSQGIKDFEGVLGFKGFLVHYFTGVERDTHAVLPRCIFGSDGRSPYGTDAAGEPICRDPLDCQDCRTVDLNEVNVIKMILKCGKPWECNYDDKWNVPTKKTCDDFHRAWFSARVDFEQSWWINGPPSFRNGRFKPDVFMGFCACSGMLCYDRMIDDKAPPNTCDNDTKTTSKVGRINLPNGSFQDQTLSVTTGQVTGSTTACVSGNITLTSPDVLLNNTTLVGKLVDFTISVNGALQSNIDASHVTAGPTGIAFGRFVVSGLDPRNREVNEIAVTATVDYDGMVVTTDDQIVLTTINLIPGTLFH